MSELSNYRITDEDVAQNGVIAAPDRLIGTAAQNKAVFDRLIRDAVKEKYNAMLTAVEDELNVISVWEPYDAEKAYRPGNKVVYNGSSYLCTAACEGVLPTDAAYWRLIAARGVDGTGAGDMRIDIYDPRHVEADVFAYVDERTDTFSRAETLSGETAQAFVNMGFAETVPQTPNEAFAAITELAALTTEIFTETTKWKAPSNIRGDVHVRVFGAGGGGGTPLSTISGASGAGGGGGHMKTHVFTPVPGQIYEVTIGAGGEANANGGATSFGNLVTADGGSCGYFSVEGYPCGGSGGSGGGAGRSGKAGDGDYGGGGGVGGGVYAGGSGYNPGSGGNGGTYGGGGGATDGTAGIGGEYGGNGGSNGSNGADGTNTIGRTLDYIGEGTGGTGNGSGGGGGGGYGGNGGNGGNGSGNYGHTGGCGGGGGYGGNGGNGGVCTVSSGGGGGGGGYGGNGGDGGNGGNGVGGGLGNGGGGGGGGYGYLGNGGKGGNGNYGGIGAGAAGEDGRLGGGGGGGGGGGYSGGKGGKGGDGVVILTYHKYVTGV